MWDYCQNNRFDSFKSIESLRAVFDARCRWRVCPQPGTGLEQIKLAGACYRFCASVNL